ncbi:MAG: hypothetical protein K2L73_00110 [Muribaculaceae bacterium]|nr:hypothetical protein [Muribaculaceae bacterium]
MEREFDRTDCSDEKLALNYDGLQVVQMNEPGLASNARIIDVSKVYNLYKRVIAFNNRSFGLNPNFRGNTGSWNSWTAHQDRIFSQQNELLNDPKFPRIKNITAVRKIYDTNNKVTDSRLNFYNRLESESSSYFNDEINRCRQLAMNSSGDNPVVGAKKSEILDCISDVRVKLANNEKYLSSSHNIFDRLRDMTKTISSL